MIGIVTVLYNSEAVLPDFFCSLEEQSYRDFQLYVIDNKSNDNSLDVTQGLANQVSFRCVILPQTENWGVAKGNNIGIREAIKDGCEYIILSNNDTVLEPNCIEQLLSGMIEMSATMAIPKIYYHGTNRIIWCAGGWFRTWKCTSPHRGARETDFGQYDSNDYVEYSPTCFMMIKSDVFSRVGMMDENYFVYYDDSDFVWRAIKRGQERLAYIYKAVLWHKESYSTGGSMSDFYIHYYNRNKVFFARKNFNFIQECVFFVYLITQYFVRSRSIYSQEQRKLYKDSCIEGWNYFSMKKDDYS